MSVGDEAGFDFLFVGGVVEELGFEPAFLKDHSENEARNHDDQIDHFLNCEHTRPEEHHQQIATLHRVPHISVKSVWLYARLAP